MSLEAITWAFAQRIRPAGRKFVLVALANYADAKGYCYPSQAEIAELTGQSDRAVRAHLVALEKAHYLRRRERFGPAGMQVTDGYHLAVVKLAATGKKKRERLISRAEDSSGEGGNNQHDGAEESADGYVGSTTNRTDTDIPAAGAAGKAPAVERSAPTEGKPTVVHWTKRACELWQNIMGGTAPGGVIGKNLKPLVKLYGEAEILEYWERYLRRAVQQRRVAYANAADFATKYEQHKAAGGIVSNGNGRGSGNQRVLAHRTALESVDLSGGAGG